jgi:hypothetical protein
MKAKTPFSKPPTSPYAIPPFYWRGGDVLREKEHVTDAFRKAFTDHRLAGQEMKQVQARLQNATRTLRERDRYTTALGGFLDDDTEDSLEEIRLKQELLELKKEIAIRTQELAKKRTIHNPGVPTDRQKEKAYY